RRLSEDGVEHAALASLLRALVPWIVQHLAVAATQDVEALPREDLEVAVAKQRREHGLHQGFAGLAIAPVVRHVMLAAELLERGRRDAERRREVHVRQTALERRVRVEHARREAR